MNTAMAIAVSAWSSPASAIDAEAARVSARFFGFAPESAAPSSAALGGVAVSMVAIQLGVSGSLPFFGRFVHCLAAIRRNRTPIAILSQLRPGSSLSGSSPAADEEHHDDAHGEQAGDPAQRERGAGRSGVRRPEDEDDGDDRDRTEGDGERRREQVADGIAQHARAPMAITG